MTQVEKTIKSPMTNEQPSLNLNDLINLSKSQQNGRRTCHRGLNAQLPTYGSIKKINKLGTGV